MFRFAAVAVLVVAPLLAQQPPEPGTEGGSITLTMGEEGMGIVEFVRWAQEITGQAFTFNEQELRKSAQGGSRVRFVGKLSFQRASFQKDFFSFFQAMLYTKGFATRIRGEGDAQITEIVPLPGSKQDRAKGAKYVPAAELQGHKADTATILTSIPLAHVAPQVAIDRVRVALEAAANDATLATIGMALLVQGTGAEVYCVSRMVRLVDVAPTMVSEVVYLQHAVAAELVVGVSVLVAGRQPSVVVVADEAANALSISGPIAVVKDVIEVVSLLDRAADK